MDYTGGPEPLQIRAAYVNAGLLETLGVAPMLGRLISPDEDVKGGTAQHGDHAPLLAANSSAAIQTCSAVR